MFLNIRDMDVRPIVFELSFSPGEIDLLEDSLRQLDNLQVAGRAELIAAVDEIRVRGNFSVKLEVACGRCLELVVWPVASEFDLYYRPMASILESGEIALKEGEVEMAFYEGAGLELKDILREQILLALPMQRLCREDCRGLCPVCGRNRNLENCSCETDVAGERWAALRKLSAK